MPASAFDSAALRDLLSDRETAALFTDTAELRAMLLVWGALAQAQAQAGLIPETAARAIQRAAMEIQIDPAALAQATGQNAVVVPALVAQFRAEMKAPEHAQYLHFGATSQDIIDTGLALRLRQVIGLAETRLAALLRALGVLARDHAATVMAGRTYGQIATPITFGAQVAGWGAPLLRLHADLPRLRAGVAQVSLSGAAGTLSAMGPRGPEVRAALARGLGLADPEASWHTGRDGPAGLAAWICQVTQQLARIGEDLVTLTSSDVGEVRLPAAGASSTMPQKQNPVGPSVLVALGRLTLGLNQVMQGAAVHRQQRDAGAWIAEWLSLPQMCLALGRGLTLAGGLVPGLVPVPDRMARNLDDGSGLIFAEALSFRLARDMPRPEAQAEVKALCREVLAKGGSLAARAAARWPDRDLGGAFDPAAQTGTAPEEARRFAAATGALT